jgi:DNA-binding MarR family transcriptional regulator
MAAGEPAAAAASARREIWRRYFESSALLTHRLEQSLRTHAGLSLADYNVLLLLSEAPGRRMRMGELARRLVFSPSRLTYLVSSLQERGLVERGQSPQDRRGRVACLTDEGTRAFRRAAIRHARDVDRLFLADLSEEEAAVLGRVFTRLGEELGEEPAER